MRLVIISGRSGSGKSTALHVLEDLGYYCIDNIPGGLIPALIEEMQQHPSNHKRKVAISIDARNLPENLKRFPQIIQTIDQAGIDSSTVYLDADDQTILTRFSATRRKHPLSNESTSLEEAIYQESELLDAIAGVADLKIDTTHLNLHQLRDIVTQQIAQQNSMQLALLFESFGFKRGVPVDADLVFDVRCLPNPHWENQLKALSGKDQPVIDYFARHRIVTEMLADICQFLEKWLPRFEANNRSYMTVAIGCTGGQHRSVYIAEQLARRFKQPSSNVQVRHRDLGPTVS